MTSRLASVTFKVLIEETDKNLDFIAEILFRLLRFGDFKVSIVIENSSGVINSKDSFLSSNKFYEQSYRPVTLLRAST